MARTPGTYATFNTSEGNIVCRLFESSRGVYVPTKEYWRSPGKIIVRIVPSHEVDVSRAHTSGAIALEKEQMSVVGKSWPGIRIRGISRSTSIDRGLPRTADAFAS